MPTSDCVYVYLQLPGSLQVVTVGYFEQAVRTGVPIGMFVYNPAYLAGRGAHRPDEADGREPLACGSAQPRGG